MKAISCMVCGYIAIDGAAPAVCPVCGAPQTAFKETNDLKTAKDIAVTGESEKKHIPAITVVKKCGLIPDGCTDVHVKVGEVTHPMLPEHFIRHIDFYLDKKFIARVSLTPGALNPAAALHLKASSGVVTAIELCNLHGPWMNEASL